MATKTYNIKFHKDETFVSEQGNSESSVRTTTGEGDFYIKSTLCELLEKYSI